jgi:hypothetical protein
LDMRRGSVAVGGGRGASAAGRELVALHENGPRGV